MRSRCIGWSESEDALTRAAHPTPGGAEFGEWRDGYHLRIDTEEEFEQLVTLLASSPLPPPFGEPGINPMGDELESVSYPPCE